MTPVVPTPEQVERARDCDPYVLVSYGGIRPHSVEGPGIPRGHGPMCESEQEAYAIACWMHDAHSAALAEADAAGYARGLAEEREAIARQLEDSSERWREAQSRVGDTIVSRACELRADEVHRHAFNVRSRTAPVKP